MSSSGPCICLQTLPAAHLGILQPPWGASEAQQEPPEAARGGKEGFASRYCDRRPGRTRTNGNFRNFHMLPEPENLPAAHLGGFSRSLGVSLQPAWEVSEAQQEPMEAAGGGKEGRRKGGFRRPSLWCSSRGNRTQECFTDPINSHCNPTAAQENLENPQETPTPRQRATVD